MTDISSPSFGRKRQCTTNKLSNHYFNSTNNPTSNDWNDGTGDRYHETDSGNGSYGTDNGDKYQRTDEMVSSPQVRGMEKGGEWGGSQSFFSNTNRDDGSYSNSMIPSNHHSQNQHHQKVQHQHNLPEHSSRNVQSTDSISNPWDKNSNDMWGPPLGGPTGGTPDQQTQSLHPQMPVLFKIT